MKAISLIAMRQVIYEALEAANIDIEGTGCGVGEDAEKIGADIEIFYAGDDWSINIRRNAE